MPHLLLETSHDIYQHFVGEPHGIEILVNLGEGGEGRRVRPRLRKVISVQV